jgi:hypothetical protein
MPEISYLIFFILEFRVEQARSHGGTDLLKLAVKRYDRLAGCFASGLFKESRV